MKHFFKSLVILSLLCSVSDAQEVNEREHRIKKSQFPIVEQAFLSGREGVKQVRFYKEVDHSRPVYIMKFKQDKLRYFMSLDPEGTLQNMGFRIEEIDFPSDSYANIHAYLSANFSKFNIRRMFQEYPVANNNDSEKTVENAFQNMLLPDNKYRLIILAKKEEKRASYELYFDAGGNFEKIRQLLPANYDHILY